MSRAGLSSIAQQGDNFRLVEGKDAEASLAAHFGSEELRAFWDRPSGSNLNPAPRPDKDHEAWSAEDDAYLRQLTPDHNDASIGVLLGRTPVAVRNRRSNLGIKRSSW